MDALASPVALHRALPPEEAARGDFYALFARLLHDGPDGALLRSLAGADPIPGEGALSAAWRDLVDASSAMDADAAQEEFEALFVGVGRSEVSPYAGYYMGAPAIDHPRVRIQADLAAFGLAHREDAAEPEDHFAGLFDASARIEIPNGRFTRWMTDASAAKSRAKSRLTMIRIGTSKSDSTRSRCSRRTGTGRHS